MKNFFSKIVNTFYWPWIIDLIIGVLSLVGLVYFVALAILDFDIFDMWASIISVFPFLYSVNNALTKWNENKIQRDSFIRHLDPVLGDCRKVILKHFPKSIDSIDEVEEGVIIAHFEEWKKYRNIKPFEYLLLETYQELLAEKLGLDNSEKLLLKYILVTSTFSLYYPKIVSELEKGDYFTEGSPHNIFIRKLYYFMNEGKPLCKVESPALSPETIEETINIAINTKSTFIYELLQEKEQKKKVEYLLNKCFENAYTNTGRLNLELKDDNKRKIIFLYKYDERFSILKKILNQSIKEQIKSGSNENYTLIEEKIYTEQEKLAEIMYPLPFAKALNDFPYCIEKISPRDHFAFIIYPNKFYGETAGWSSEKFMLDMVIPQAKQHQDIFNQKLVREFPYLKKHQKQILDTNFYLFEFSRNNFTYHATQDSIPETIKRFLIRDILDSENAGNIVVSQLIYLKQVINNLSLSGLLFTEEPKMQERISEIEDHIIEQARRNGLIIHNIYDLIAIGNQLTIFEKILHKLLHNQELTRRIGKKYNETIYIANTIIKNAKDIISVFNSIKEGN